MAITPSSNGTFVRRTSPLPVLPEQPRRLLLELLPLAAGLQLGVVAQDPLEQHGAVLAAHHLLQHDDALAGAAEVRGR